MPARQDINSILIIGAGPIVIGQACEFDYSGVQACRALKEEGYRVILANSNPATIMTDPEFADATYLEPLRSDILAQIIEKEKPDAVLSTLGGQTALNLTIELFEMGALQGVELLGADLDAITTAENRAQFKEAMLEIGLSLPESAVADSKRSAKEVLENLGLSVIIRPAYILGGAGAGVATTQAEFDEMVERGLAASPIGQILIEESIAGWKEFELEVMRDKNDNCVVICSIENFNPMGVHTGDSITVAPAQTLSDWEYQQMRNDAFACIRRVGVETGGSNIQFAVNPEDGRRVVIEMNPRVSRSSALASKATGFPIAKIASRLAVGYTLDEITNDITGATPASFEPAIDYVVTKIPRFAFEKLPGTSGVLGASMQSVGEVMSIGRTFPESLQKAIRSLELGRAGLNADLAEVDIGRAKDNRHNNVNNEDIKPKGESGIAKKDGGDNGMGGNDSSRNDLIEELIEKCEAPTAEQIFHVETAIRAGADIKELSQRTKIDRWFLDQIARISKARLELEEFGLDLEEPRQEKSGQEKSAREKLNAILPAKELKRLKQLGFSDEQIAFILSNSASKNLNQAGRQDITEPEITQSNITQFNITQAEITQAREAAGIFPTYKNVDTCAGEFFSETPYSYSTYEDTDELVGTPAKKVMILGSGPNRIGQGIEFDYCCVHASFALREAGYETIMVNCNPETVSTDYDTSDRLYFEPLTIEDVSNIIEAENRIAKSSGTPSVEKVIVSLGGQTPLKLAAHLPPEMIAGTPVDSIDLAEDRQRWTDLCAELEIAVPIGATATDEKSALAVAGEIGYPLLVRPSYVLGGRAMEIVDSDEQLVNAMRKMAEMSGLGREGELASQRPILLDKFLEDAIEVDVDALRDEAGEVMIGGVMEHIEEAGVHSGDSACVLPPYSLAESTLAVIEEYTVRIANALSVVGLINIQFGIVPTGRNGRHKQNTKKASGDTVDDINTADDIYVLEANPRASRTVPFVSKATGIPLAKIATRLMMGDSLAELRKEKVLTDAKEKGKNAAGHISVKEAVLPFDRFLGTDAVLGPEMRSTGEVMGIDETTAMAYGKSQIAAGVNLVQTAQNAKIFFSLSDKDKTKGAELAARLVALGFELVATRGTAKALTDSGVVVSALVAKLEETHDAETPLDAVELIEEGHIAFVVNTPQGMGHGKRARADGSRIRRAAIAEKIPLFTTLSAVEAAVGALEELQTSEFQVRSLQEYHAQL